MATFSWKAEKLLGPNWLNSTFQVRLTGPFHLVSHGVDRPQVGASGWSHKASWSQPEPPGVRSAVSARA